MEEDDRSRVIAQRVAEDVARRDGRRLQRSDENLPLAENAVPGIEEDPAAEALVSHASSNKPRAIQLLRGVISAPNNPQYIVEDTAATEDAKVLLKRFGG